MESRLKVWAGCGGAVSALNLTANGVAVEYSNTFLIYSTTDKKYGRIEAKSANFTRANSVPSVIIYPHHFQRLLLRENFGEDLYTDLSRQLH